MIELKRSDELNIDEAKVLVGYLESDTELIMMLGNKGKIIDPEDFIRNNIAWESDNRADVFYIIYEDIPVGMISLSKQEPSRGSAHIGYWIGSRFWNMGITGRAFDMVLGEGISRGLSTFYGKISRENAYSLRIWERRGAEFNRSGEMYEATLSIKKDLL